MNSILTLTLLYIVHTDANPLHLQSSYLDPILYQEYTQSPNGHYKYGYESKSVAAQQTHDADGTSRGFYTFVDDQGKVQNVEYTAGRSGFKVLESSGGTGFTPEVEAARKAHLAAFAATQRRDLLGVASALKVQSESILEAHKRDFTSVLNQAKQLEDINLFSGLPLARRVEAPLFPSTSTIRPITSMVQGYDTISQSPRYKFRDLSIEVNGQNRYDPRVQYNHWNNGPYSRLPLYHTVIKPIVKPTEPPPVKVMTNVARPGLTAHQADLLQYRQGVPIDTPISQPTNEEAKNKFVGFARPVTKVVVTKSHVHIKQSSAAEKAFENALMKFKSKYNLS